MMRRTLRFTRPFSVSLTRGTSYNPHRSLLTTSYSKGPSEVCLPPFAHLNTSCNHTLTQESNYLAPSPGANNSTALCVHRLSIRRQNCCCLASPEAASYV